MEGQLIREEHVYWDKAALLERAWAQAPEPSCPAESRPQMGAAQRNWTDMRAARARFLARLADQAATTRREKGLSAA
jgi:hypothetical protein